jgi:hypothetical protein
LLLAVFRYELFGDFSTFAIGLKRVIEPALEVVDLTQPEESFGAIRASLRIASRLGTYLLVKGKCLR